MQTFTLADDYDITTGDARTVVCDDPASPIKLQHGRQ
jgi:hypothetical protein